MAQSRPYSGVVVNEDYYQAEYEIANYHLNAIKSGFHIGTIITFVGKPTPTEQDEIERQLKNKFQGTDKLKGFSKGLYCLLAYKIENYPHLWILFLYRSFYVSIEHYFSAVICYFTFFF